MTHDTDEPNFFGQLLSLLDSEELLRLQVRIRAKKKLYKRLSEILGDEIVEREGIEREIREQERKEAKALEAGSA